MESGGLATTVAHSDMRCCVLIPAEPPTPNNSPLQNWTCAQHVPGSGQKKKMVSRRLEEFQEFLLQVLRQIG